MAAQVVGKINRIDVEEWANERVGNTPVKLCRPENCDNDGQVKIALSVAYQEREEICVDSFRSLGAQVTTGQEEELRAWIDAPKA
eukprot:1828310-Pyramimonas_sp.AAC.1